MSNSVYKNTNVVYWTHTLTNTFAINNGDLSRVPTIQAEINTQLKTPIVKQGTKWLMAVERFSINGNAIPFYDPSDDEKNGEFLRAETIPGGVQSNALRFPVSYSLVELVNNINRVITDISNAGVGFNDFPPFVENGQIRFSMGVDTDGYVRCIMSRTGVPNDPTDTGWAGFKLLIPNKLNQILGMYLEDKPTPLGAPYRNDPIIWRSRHPRWDCGDSGARIRISSNIGVSSDNLQGGQTNILTDLEIPTGTFGRGGPSPISNLEINQTFSLAHRQKIDYAPQRLRWLNIVDPSPIYQMVISANYVTPDGTSKIIELPVGMSFSIKLAFYSRN